MTARARSFWTINGIGTLIIYRDRVRSAKAHYLAFLLKPLKPPHAVISQTDGP